MSILVYVEHHGDTIAPGSLGVLGAAKELAASVGTTVTALVAGPGADTIAASVPADTVYHATGERFQVAAGGSDALAAAVAASGAQVVLAAGSVNSADVCGGLAGRLGVGRSVICGPGGEIIYEANIGREIIPFEVDLEYLRRCRETGWQGLHQLLKSFRDHPVVFPAYGAARAESEALNRLGPLELPKRL